MMSHQAMAIKGKDGIRGHSEMEKMLPEKLLLFYQQVLSTPEVLQAYLKDSVHFDVNDDEQDLMMQTLETYFDKKDEKTESNKDLPFDEGAISAIEDLTNALGPEWIRFASNYFATKATNALNDKQRKHRIYETSAKFNRSLSKLQSSKLKSADYGCFNRSFGVQEESLPVSPVAKTKITNVYCGGLDPSTPGTLKTQGTHSRILEDKHRDVNLPVSPVKPPKKLTGLPGEYSSSRPGSCRFEYARARTADGLAIHSRQRTRIVFPGGDPNPEKGAILKPLKHPEIAKQKSINDKLQTVGSSMLAFGAELSSIIMEDMKGERAPTGSFELNEITSMHVQSKITRRIFEESKEKGERNSVIERLRCDGYDKAVGPTKLYLSTTKRFLEEVDGGVDELKNIDKRFYLKMGLLQQFAEEANRLGKKTFERGSGGFRYT